MKDQPTNENDLNENINHLQSIQHSNTIPQPINKELNELESSNKNDQYNSIEEEKINEVNQRGSSIDLNEVLKCDLCYSIDKTKLLKCHLCNKNQCKECISKETQNYSGSTKNVDATIFICKKCLSKDNTTTKIKAKSINHLSNKRYRDNNTDDNGLLDLDVLRSDVIVDSSTEIKPLNKKRAYTKRNIKPVQPLQSSTQGYQSQSQSQHQNQKKKGKDLIDQKETLLEMQKTYVDKVESNRCVGMAKCGICNEMKYMPYLFKTYFDILFYAKHLCELEPILPKSKKEFNDFFESQTPLISPNKDFSPDNIICEDCLTDQIHKGFPFLITVGILYNQNKNESIDNPHNKRIQISIEEIKKVFFLSQFLSIMQKHYIRKIYNVVKQFIEKMTNNQVNVEFTLKKIFDNATAKDKNNIEHYHSLQNLNSTAIMLIQELNDTMNQFQLTGDLVDPKANSSNNGSNMPNISNALLNAMELSNNTLQQYQARHDVDGPLINLAQLNAMNQLNIDSNALNQLLNQFKTPLPMLNGLNTNINPNTNTQPQINPISQLPMQINQSQIPNTQQSTQKPLNQFQMPLQSMSQSTQPSANLFLEQNMPYLLNNLAQNQMMNNPNANNPNPMLTIQPGLVPPLDLNTLLQLMKQNPPNNIYNHQLTQQMLEQNQSRAPSMNNLTPSNQPLQNNSNINLNFLHPIHLVNAYQGIDPSLLSNNPPQLFQGLLNQYPPQNNNQLNQNDNYLTTLSHMMNINGGGMNQSPINKNK